MKVKGSYLWAGAIILGLGAWLWSDDLLQNTEVQANGNAGADMAATDMASVGAAEKAKTPDKLPTVRVQTIAAEERFSELVIRGRTEAARRVELRGETSGKVVATPVKKGQMARKGDVVCQLDMADRQASRDQAKAALDLATLDYDVAQNLGKKGYGAKNKEMAQRASYDAAQAALVRANLDISRTQITAPFDGIVESRAAEEGAYVSVGGPCATMVDLSPLLVVGYVGEREVGKLKTGMAAKARLVTGEEVEGTINFISSSAEPETRTFRTEIEVPNKDFALKDGVTSEIAVPLAPLKAHRFSPAVLTLRDDGVVGVRLVDENDVVAFAPVKILASDKNGIWVSGLPDKPTIITVGHEYVQAGQKVKRVDAVPAKTAEIAQ